MRILVTGSRNWDDEETICAALDNAVRGVSYPKVTLVHGHCPTGADALADRWAQEREIDIERHPADWTRYGRAAGPIRNQEMVDLGADTCLAFLMPNSRGTKDCMNRAVQAGIAVRKFESEGDSR